MTNETGRKAPSKGHPPFCGHECCGKTSKVQAKRLSARTLRRRAKSDAAREADLEVAEARE